MNTPPQMLTHVSITQAPRPTKRAHQSLLGPTIPDLHLRRSQLPCDRQGDMERRFRRRVLPQQIPALRRRQALPKYLQHKLQVRLDADAALGVDPGTMIGGMQRLAPWVIRVLLFKVVYPVVLYLNPAGGPVRPLSRSAGDVLGAAIGAGGSGGEMPKNGYFDGRVPVETGEESRDQVKREVVWRETVRLAGLKEGETVLTNWQ
ncbi:MAG: hypothetical protein Q9160_003304 [Pyrenula sp. 1 TL-2023]